mgnify:CR=1 FL=1
MGLFKLSHFLIDKEDSSFEDETLWNETGSKPTNNKELPHYFLCCCIYCCNSCCSLVDMTVLLTRKKSKITDDQQITLHGEIIIEDIKSKYFNCLDSAIATANDGEDFTHRKKR